MSTKTIDIGNAPNMTTPPRHDGFRHISDFVNEVLPGLTQPPRAPPPDAGTRTFALPGSPTVALTRLTRASTTTAQSVMTLEMAISALRDAGRDDLARQLDNSVEFERALRVRIHAVARCLAEDR